MRIKVSEDLLESRAVIKVIGVGGAGGNAVNRMSEAGIQGVELIAANSDAQDLRRSLAEIRIQVGETLTKGLGVGGDADLGRRAAEESEAQLREVLEGTDLVFITAGMGGGTGTGGAPLVAKIAKELGALTIGVVTRPFNFEKHLKASIADQGIQQMRQNVDTLLVIPNQKLFETVDPSTPSDEAFKLADDVLRKSVQSISDVITTPGRINMDLNDLKAVMKDAGEALIGMAEAEGHGRAQNAARAAVQSPLLENVVIDGAKGLIVNITARKSMGLNEIEDAAGLISATASPDARVKVGMVYDETMGERIRVTVIATGFPPRKQRGLRRPGYRSVGPPTRRTWGDPREPMEPRPVAAPASPDDWTKPAYMRLKVRRLK